MPRPLRVDVADALHHVTGRANSPEGMFLGGADREAFLELLGCAVKRYRWRCGAYCLMGTHYHLLLETPLPTLAVGMHWLHSAYSRDFNKRHGRFGHVLRERYGSVLVESDSHAIEVLRYIALNPVRARLCAGPAEWPWSSYAAAIGSRSAPRLLDRRLVGRLLGEPEDRVRVLLRLQLLVEDVSVESVS